jgi:hypothetical protein
MPVLAPLSPLQADSSAMFEPMSQHQAEVLTRGLRLAILYQ